MIDWLRSVLRRKPVAKPDDDQAARLAALSQRAHATVVAANRTLQEAKALDDAMRAAEQSVRRS